MEIININFEDRTAPVSQFGLKKILVYTKAKNVVYAEGDTTAAFTGLTASDPAYKAISAILAQGKQTVAVFGDDTHGVEDALNSIAGKDFFFLCPVGLTVAEYVEASTWATSNERIMKCTPLFSTSVADVAAMKASMNSESSEVYAHKGTVGGEQVYFAAAVTGLEALKDPGSYTLAMKSPNTVPLNEYAPSDETILLAAKINILTEEYGKAIVQQGTTTAGTYADVTRSKFWLKYRLKEELAQMFMGRDKVPFTVEGKVLIEDAINKVMAVADGMGMIVIEETKVDVPNPLDLLTNDRANRKWNGITIETRIAGAAHELGISFILNA